MNRKKSVLQYDRDGNFIRQWPSLKECVKHFSVRSPNITMCCQGKIPTAKGFVFRYEGDKVPLKINSTISKKRKGKEYYNITTNNYYDSVRSAAIELELSLSSLYQCLSGKLKTCGGFKWKYV